MVSVDHVRTKPDTSHHWGLQSATLAVQRRRHASQPLRSQEHSQRNTVTLPLQSPVNFAKQAILS